MVAQKHPADIGTILNLVCLKHTGQLLPVNWCGSPEWRYILTEGDNTPKRAIYNPLASTLLRNPFQFISDSHPIEHQIKRSMINDQIKLVFQKTITFDAIENAMKGENPFTEGCESLTPNQRYQLHKIRDGILRLSDKFKPINDLVGSRSEVTDRLALSNADQPRYRSTYYEIFIHSILLANAQHTPHINDILNTMTLESDPPKWLRQCRRIVECCGHDETLRGIQHRKRRVVRDSFGGRSWCDVSTREEFLCPIKREFWYPWLLIQIDNHNTHGYQRSQTRRSHNRRSTGKTNWWGYIKNESGSIIPYPDKETHEERLVKSILTQ